MPKPSEPLSNRTIRTLRICASSSGIVLVLGALFADPLGLSAPGLGRGQAALLVLGAVLLAVSLLRHPLRAYVTLAVIVFNVLAMLAFLELAATACFWVAGRSGAGPPVSGRHARLLESHRAAYAPFVVWREQEHSEGCFTIGPDGRRVTPGASADPRAYEVFCFGGSTMIGWGVPDSLTIPSILQRDLTRRLDVPVRVINFGQQAYVSTQELIELMLQLRSGARPDLVIFYDGVNDAYAAFQSGVAGVHENLSDVSARFSGTGESRQSILACLAGHSNLLALVRLLSEREGRLPAADRPVDYATIGVSADSLSSSIVSIYEADCRMALAMCREYGPEVAFFWQPVLGVGGRMPVGSERDALADVDRDLQDLMTVTWDDARLLSGRLQGFHFLGDCLDSSDVELFTFGDFCHVNAEGNATVERAMMKAILEDGLVPDSLLAGR